MENSRAYKCLVEQIKATGFKKLDGYDDRIIEEIYDWERDEVEDLIWIAFQENNDTDLAKFLPKLKKYNGIKALKDKLGKCRIPSGNSVNIAMVLYESLCDNQYLSIIKENIDKAADARPYVAMLSYAKPSKEMYDLLVQIYINCNDEIILDSAVRGILYNKGYIKNPFDYSEVKRVFQLIEKFDTKNKFTRKKVIKKLEENQLY